MHARYHRTFALSKWRTTAGYSFINLSVAVFSPLNALFVYVDQNYNLRSAARGDKYNEKF
jgi:hypothetical protein